MQLDRVTNHITDVLFLYIDINVWAFFLFSRFGIVEAAGKSIKYTKRENDESFLKRYKVEKGIEKQNKVMRQIFRLDNQWFK
jgi:hypothetical protein